MENTSFTPLPVNERIVYGYCTACGSVEVALNNASGTVNFSHLGENRHYPAGYGCEVCN